ncbi:MULTISPECIES: hypothetical protein [unclassified Granulicatella]|nr:MULTISPECIES: hypothetical protein [unclassified Granulicatella]
MTEMDRFMLMMCFGVAVAIVIASWIHIMCDWIDKWKGRKRK